MRTLTIVSVVLFLAACKNGEQSSFEVSGTIKNIEAKTVFLEESKLNTLQPVIVDSALIGKDGKFDLSTLSTEESVYSLRLDRDMYPFASFINDSKKVTINADFKSKELYTIKGSEASEKLKDYLKANSEKVRSIYNLSQSIDSLSKTPAMDSIAALRNQERETAAKDLKSFTVNYLNGSNSPALTMFILGSYQSMAGNGAFGVQGFNNEEVNDIIGKTAKKFPDHTSLVDLQKKIAAQPAQKQQPAAAQPTGSQGNWVNKPAPDFTLPDASGKPVSLSSFKGKYVLVDFWASWCAPCRAENPNVVKAFQQFNNKNFTILGVSLDREKEPWLKAIKDDGLAWTQVSDLKFWESMVVPLYGFEGIPYNVLIDPNGTIIGEGLRGEDLENKLKAVLK